MIRRRPMPSPVRDAIAVELADAAAAVDGTGRWRALERAHILSQPWPWPHTRVHGQMLRLAIAQRNRSEALGQVLRLIVAAPGSVTGRYPTGNTGRASVGLLQPMPLPDDLADLLATDDRSQRPTSP